jgi:glycosyltransferase involved in cell wall biosynthesis
MRVLLLNQVFYPDVAATAQHGHDLARALVAAGHEVTAIASRSLYGDATVRLPASETVDGIRIERVGRNWFGKRHLLGRMADFGLFYLAAALKSLRVGRHDVVIAFTTPPLIAGVGWLATRLRGGKLIYWSMDLYPEVAVAGGLVNRRSPAVRLVSAIDTAVMRGSAAVVALGRCMRDRILARDVSPAKVHVIPVWGEETLPATTDGENSFRRQWGVGDRQVLIMYSGNFGLGHDVQTFLGAARRLATDPTVRFAFVGGGARRAEVERFIAEHRLGNCILAPYQPRERLAELLAAGDIHLITMLPSFAGVMVPSKLYGVLAAGRPAIFVGPAEAEGALTVEELGCGAVVAPGDVDGLVSAIRGLASDREERVRMGEAGRREAAARFGRGPACEAWQRLVATLDRNGNIA